MAKLCGVQEIDTSHQQPKKVEKDNTKETIDHETDKNNKMKSKNYNRRTKTKIE